MWVDDFLTSLRWLKSQLKRCAALLFVNQWYSMMLMETVCPRSNETAPHCTDEVIIQSTQQNEGWETSTASRAAIWLADLQLQCRCELLSNIPGSIGYWCTCSLHQGECLMHLHFQPQSIRRDTFRGHSLVDYSQLCFYSVSFGPRSRGSVFPLNTIVRMRTVEHPWGDSPLTWNNLQFD